MNIIKYLRVKFIKQIKINVISLCVFFLLVGVYMPKVYAANPNWGRNDCYGTGNPFLYGQCTWYVYGRTKEKTGITLSSRTSQWVYSSKTGGYSSVPSNNSIAMFMGSDGIQRHVAFIESYDGINVTYSEGNASDGIGSQGYKTGTMSPSALFNRTKNYNSEIQYVTYVPLENQASIVEPTIAANKDSYTVGETVNLSWNASPSNSNLSHYWLIINAPNGRELFGGTMNKNTSYSFVANDVGTYQVTVYATPLGSQQGEGSLVARKSITVKSKIAQPAKPTLVVKTGDSKVSTNFSWKTTNNTYHYDLRIYNATTNKYYSFQPNLKVTSYNLVLPAGKYYANVASVASDANIYTFSDNVYFTIENAPTVSNDGWYYVNSLASYVTADKYEIQYQNYYEKIQKSSPGSDWKNVGLSKSEYENSGNAYWSKIELPTSNTRVLLNYKYYHYCGGNIGNRANYEVNGNYIHYDQIQNVNDVVVDQSGSDWENPNYKYYYLKWKNGNYAYCNSNSTCDGQYGTHGNRSFVWYKEGQYQNKVKVDYYKYTKQTGWSSKKDSTATSVKYRYKLKTAFKDVSPKAWYYDTINEVNQLGLMTGTTSTNFSPDSSMSRGMVATVLYRMAGAPNVIYKNIFNDVNKSDYYAQAVTWAYNNKIISGYSNGKFGPNDNVTREQIAVMLCNYARYKGVKINSNKDLSAFKDKGKISSYAIPSMKWVVEKGIITGTEDKKLNPTNNATRAECAKMLLQVYKLFT